MKKMNITIVFFFSILLISCNNHSPELSEEEAKQLVLEHHSKSIGTVEIVSIKAESDGYRVVWKNVENCERGTDIVNQKGEVEMVVSEIC
ncbi:hypothetical protein [Bacillus pinisoli]|uniref:hypothetical protein n=1 Tax=Bacillus pinisoli TaxID=2901866 RepID=UPI001FF2323F|nr:hypothetical protein [Bacillus pinisoli]